MVDEMYGYPLDEIGEIATELFQVLAELTIPKRLALLALCQAIVMTGDEQDMDEACVMIDRLKELAAEDTEYEEDEEEGDDDEDSDF